MDVLKFPKQRKKIKKKTEKTEKNRKNIKLCTLFKHPLHRFQGSTVKRF